MALFEDCSCEPVHLRLQNVDLEYLETTIKTSVIAHNGNPQAYVSVSMYFDFGLKYIFGHKKSRPGMRRHLWDGLVKKL
jgi:hypothetical protein